MCYYLLLCKQGYPIFYYSGVFSHPSIYNTSVLQLGKPIIGRQQSYVTGDTLNILQTGTCWAWGIIAFMMCNFSNSGGSVSMAISSPAYMCNISTL